VQVVLREARRSAPGRRNRSESRTGM